MCHRVSNNIKGKCVQGRISKTYIINSKSNCIVLYYTYCLQDTLDSSATAPARCTGGEETDIFTTSQTNTIFAAATRI